jgi:hypothetical protein
MVMHSIEVDDEVFRILQGEARPFFDTPNDVLRRLLLRRPEQTSRPNIPPTPTVPAMPITAHPTGSPDAFVRQVLSKEFGAGFRRVAPYRMMYQDADRLIYFQNFNKAADHLWFRIASKPWKRLRQNGKNAWICFTNPAERYAYLLPVADIIERVHRSGWSRDYLEVNIDPGSSNWTELKWDLSDYRKVYGRAV